MKNTLDFRIEIEPPRTADESADDGGCRRLRDYLDDLYRPWTQAKHDENATNGSVYSVLIPDPHKYSAFYPAD